MNDRPHPPDLNSSDPALIDGSLKAPGIAELADDIHLPVLVGGLVQGCRRGATAATVRRRLPGSLWGVNKERERDTGALKKPYNSSLLCLLPALR